MHFGQERWSEVATSDPGSKICSVSASVPALSGAASGSRLTTIKRWMFFPATTGETQAQRCGP